MNGSTQTQLEFVTQKLRELILAGHFQPGHKIAEMALAERLAVSRTPIRLALEILENEGLLVSAPRRGFRVKEFTIEEVVDAIEVRGQLEGMAARLAAERGLPPKLAERIRNCLADSSAIVERCDPDPADRAHWVECNQCFHSSLVEAAGNAALAASIEFVGRIPLAPPSAIIFDTAHPAAMQGQLAAALADHRAVFDAVERRQGSRAEALMREHAYRSRENKLKNIAELKQNREPARLPGLDLVSTPRQPESAANDAARDVDRKPEGQ